MFLSRVFHEITQAYNEEKRYVISQGGTSSTKTFSTLQFLTEMSRKYDLKIDIVGQSVPHLKDGVLTDMNNVCKDFGINFDLNYNKSDKVFKSGVGSMNFLSIDKLGKAHGGRRDILFINEANYIPWKIAEQLMIRTRDFVIIDYNPTSEFWAQTEILKNEESKTHFIQSTYRDNAMLEQAIIDSIEAKRHNKNFWRVYGEGELGFAEGLVFENWEVKDFDKEAFAEYRHGVDWGFSQDPFAYVRLAIDKKKKEIWICDEIYKVGLLNSASAPLVKPYSKYDIVYCDSAEPKSVAEYRTLGINAKSADKGQGSIETGIKFLQDYKIYIHPTCRNITQEFQTYRWVEDKKTGMFLPKPEDANNHAIDAIRYAVCKDSAHKKKTRIIKL
jgi:phage terminase large subunit